jgi:xanthine/uracil permease
MRLSHSRETLMSPHPGYFPHWKLRTEGVIAPDERLPAAQTIALGLQHVVAMFGATVLAPLLMGFDPNVAILFSGIGSLIFSRRSAGACRATSARASRSSPW